MPEDKPFAHLNDTNAFRAMVRKRLTFALAAPVMMSLAVMVLLSLRKRYRQ